MLNNTSNFYKPKTISFQVMGLDGITSEFLNWCMQYRDNLEFIKECKSFEKASQSFTLHIDHLKIVQKIDDVVSHKREGLTTQQEGI